MNLKHVCQILPKEVTQYNVELVDNESTISLKTNCILALRQR